MPIEIRELIIKASVSQNQREEDSSQGGTGSSAAMPTKDELISECVELVMELLKLQKER